MHEKHVLNCGEKDAIRKTLSQNVTDFALGANDPEEIWIPCGAIRWKKDLVDQFGGEPRGSF